MKPQRFFRRWERQYHKLFGRQWTVLRQSREEGSLEQVHELRVTLRRLRLMLRVAAPLVDGVEARRYGAWSRRLLNATSRLRDYDAALEWLGQQSESTPAVRSIERTRLRLWRTAKARMKEPPAKTRSRLVRFELCHRGKTRLEKRFYRQLSRLEATIAHDLPKIHDLNPEERHGVRRKLRRVRYLLEICLPRRKLATDRMLKTINRLQTAMGEFQNLINAAQILSRVPDRDVPTPLRKLLSQQQAAWEEEIRRCSSTWVRSGKARKSTPSRQGATSPMSPATPSGEDV